LVILEKKKSNERDNFVTEQLSRQMTGLLRDKHGGRQVSAGEAERERETTLFSFSKAKFCPQLMFILIIFNKNLITGS